MLERENKVLKEQNSLLLDNLMKVASGQVDQLVQSLTKVLSLQRARIADLESQFNELWDKHKTLLKQQERVVQSQQQQRRRPALSIDQAEQRARNNAELL